jgi:hypothetical protein
VAVAINDLTTRGLAPAPAAIVAAPACIVLLPR